MSNPQVVVGSFTGTGAAQNIVIGFQPDHVEILDATNFGILDVWFRGIAAGTSVQSSGALRAAPGGITAYAGSSAGAGEGFTVGAALSVSGATMRFKATRSGPGAN